MKVPSEQRYVRSVCSLANGAHIVVALHHNLASLIHSALWLMVDTTFKPVHGDTNEWNIVIWTANTRQREVLYTVFVFSCWQHHICQVLFRVASGAIAKIASTLEWCIGQSMNFRVFDHKSSLLGILADEEAAQALGLGDCIDDQKLNSPAVSGLAGSGEELLPYIHKTCWVHWCWWVFHYVHCY